MFIHQLLLGLPLYGYVSQSSKKALTGSFAPSSDMVLLQETDVTTEDGEADTHFLNGAHARTSETPGIQESDKVTINATLTSWWGQQIPFSAIVKAGALVKKSDGSYGEGGGFTMGRSSASLSYGTF